MAGHGCGQPIQIGTVASRGHVVSYYDLESISLDTILEHLLLSMPRSFISSDWNSPFIEQRRLRIENQRVTHP
jgi:hypothetical protein